MQPEQNAWTVETMAASFAGHPWVPSLAAALPIAVVRFFRHQCIQWGAALAYYTLIGLVPLLCAVFALLKGVGLHRGLSPYIVHTIGAGSSEVAQQVVHFIDETNVRAVGVLSAIAAVLAVFGILGNAEMCFNSIWGGVRGRPFWRKLSAYSQVAVLAPLLLLMTLGLTAVLRPGTRTYAFFDSLYLGDVVLVALRVAPYALLWFGFTLIYTRLPNTTVRTRSAIFGAVVAGTLWQLAQWTYVTFVIGLVRYSAVYGALWQLPILLAWIYIGWLIVLSGAEVCRAHDEVVARRQESGIRDEGGETNGQQSRDEVEGLVTDL